MAQRSITSFFTRTQPLQKSNTCEGKSDALAALGLRKRKQVIYSSSEEDEVPANVIGTPPRKKANNEEKFTGNVRLEANNEELVNADEEKKTPPSPLLDFTKGEGKPIRKTAPRVFPPSNELSPSIKRILEENGGKKKESSPVEDDVNKLDSSLTDDIKPLDDGENLDNNGRVSEKLASSSKDKEKSEVSKKPPKEHKKRIILRSKLSIFLAGKTNTSSAAKQPIEETNKNAEISGKEVIQEDIDVREEKENDSSRTILPRSDDTPEKSSVTKVIRTYFGPNKKDKDGKHVAETVEPGVDYNPAKNRYHPIDDAFWSHKEKVPYLALARTLEEIENVSARLKMIEILSNYLRSVIVLSPDDLLPSVYLCLNKLAPAYESLELGVAETTLLKAIAQSTGRTSAQIKADAAAAGDLGIVAEQSRSTQRMMFKPSPLTVRGVFDKLKEIAQMSGHASVAKKVDKIQTMFVACRYSEARYLIRSLAGKLRIGLAEQSVLQALALACATTPPGQEYPPEQIDVARSMSSDAFKSLYDEEALTIKITYCECPNYDLIIPVILREGVKALPQHCRLTPGIPLKPMLAHPTKGVSEVLQRFEGLRFTCEWKYDGERAQIHLTEDGKVYIFSRNQENNTSKYPDIVSRLQNCLGPDVKSCVLDTEAVAWDSVNKRIQPFQVLSTRKKKDCQESDIKVQVCVFIFDLLYLNGDSLVRKPLIERREMLKKNFKAVPEQFEFATNLDTSTLEEMQEFLEESVKGNCEGLMVKTLEIDATYEIAKRSRNWLKLKKDYLDGVGDTLDLVVIGGYLGKGKRTGMYGGFLLACYNPDTEQYQSICKIGTGFSDDALQKHSESLKDLIIPNPRPYYSYDSTHQPDHWFDATQVWEVKCADLSLSPVHHAGIGIVDPEKGISLRFPRFIRVREDKQAEEATSAQQVSEMYRNQDQIKNQQDSNKIAEEDFY